MESDSANRALDNFRKYLRINSAQPNVNYDECVQFLTKLGTEIGLEVRIIEFMPKKPIIVMSHLGDMEIKSIFLNSHMDVVPAEKDKWTHDPFEAEMDKDGNIYGRGAQDMKCVGIQYLEAMRRLKKNKVPLKRTVHVVFVPDEEISGPYGMPALVNSMDFIYLNVGFCLDEGYAYEGEEFYLFNGDKSCWLIEFRSRGTGGHASFPLEDTPGEKLSIFMDKMNKFRRSEIEKMQSDPEMKAWNITTVNLTMLQGGVETNIVPDEFRATYDIRLALDSNEKEIEDNIRKWAAESGNNCEVTITKSRPKVLPTKLDESNKFWAPFKKATEKMNIKLLHAINLAAADSAYLRRIGIPALNFSPMNHTKTRMHTHDEYLHKDIFLKGIDIYYNIIEAVANA